MWAAEDDDIALGVALSLSHADGAGATGPIATADAAADYAVKQHNRANNLFLLSTANSNHIKTYTHLKENIEESLT